MQSRRICGYDAAVTLIRVREAAELLGVSDDTVRRWIDDGSLPAGPFTVVSLMSADAVRELKLEPGSVAVAVVKATTVIVETPGGQE
jgi:hypothetical protein